VRKGHASRTAEQNALFRALETARPRRTRLFDDPLARRFLTWPYVLVGQLGRLAGARHFFIWYIDRRWPGVRSSVVARTRLIDETIAASLSGIGQVVILGAGFDSRAYRLAALRDVAIFEVDHPDTQAVKRRVLERVVPDRARRVRFVACDFTDGALESAMAAAGYDERAPAFILWEGVSNCLTEAAVDATLRWCARAAAGSRVLFTYVHRDILTRPESFVGTGRLFASLDKAGEPLTWGIEPQALDAFLSARGLGLESDIGAAEYRKRYFGAAARRMRGHEFYRVALARVTPEAARAR
jgi:methyltransferase (TIGR00027 family)